MQKTLSIASVTIRELARQPLLYLLLGCFIALMFGMPYLVLFDFEFRLPMMAEFGLSSFTLWGLLIVLVSIHATLTPELENRTLMTLLAKPVGRVHFLTGKFLGILVPLIIALIPVVVTFVFVMKGQHYDYKIQNTASPTPELLASISTQYWETLGRTIIQGAVLSVVHGAVLAAVGVVMTANLPGLMGIVITFLVYVVGHLVGLVQVSLEAVQLPELITQLLIWMTWLLPNLESFSLVEFVSEDDGITLEYFALAALNGFFYCITILFVGSHWFARKEMA